MRKSKYLKLKKERKILRRQSKGKHDRLWAYFKGMVKDKSKANKVYDDFIEICSKTNDKTNELISMGYYDTDLKVRQRGILIAKNK